MGMLGIDRFFFPCLAFEMTAKNPFDQRGKKNGPVIIVTRNNAQRASNSKWRPLNTNTNNSIMKLLFNV